MHRAGLDTTQKVARVKRLLDRLGAYERYWLYPGAANLEAFRGYLADLATERLTDEVALAVRLLSEYGDRAALFDTAAPLADQELEARAKQQQFYTVLLADDSPGRGSRKPGREPAGTAQSVRRRAVRTAGRVQRRGRHHRGGAKR